MCDDGKSESSKGANAVTVAARIAGMGLAVASAVLMATSSPRPVYAADGARPHTVTYSDYSTFVYLVGDTATAAFLEAIAVFLSVWKKGKDKRAKWLMPLLEAAVPALLYSATGAAFAAEANMSYCSAYGKRVSVCAGAGSGAGGSNFCSQVHVSVYLSLAAGFAVSFAEVVKNVRVSISVVGSDSDCSPSSESGGCDHGCHNKH